METATRSVAVVATKLPTIDRRALSQAWYSALHLAQPGGAAAPHGAPGATRPGSGTFAALPARPPGGDPSSGKPVHAGAARSAASSSARSRAVNAPALERREPAGRLAQRIEHAIVRHGVHARFGTAALAIDAGNGRVHVLVRTDGATTRIVALCAPHLRERVDRALAQARFALAASAPRSEAAP